jgi:S-adenosylmethionine synthetase
VVLAGEITTHANVDFIQVAREAIKRVGYDNTDYGIDYRGCAVLVGYGKQSPDIAQGVNKAQDDPLNQGAGDQGLMFGYACDETPELMPMTIMLAHKLTRRLSEVRRKEILPYLRPDGKSQVTIEYRDGKPYRLHTIVVSSQHSPDVTLKQLRKEIIEEVILPVLPKKLLDEKTIIYHINPTGRFVTGGPMGDTGLTGRKIIVDTYGGVGSHGGGCFSGKDPTKVDRSASYMARYVAKNIVASGIATECEVQLAYAIGVADPVSVLVETFGTHKVDPEIIPDLIRAHFKLTPKGIIDSLKLRRPIYCKTAAYGHFGRNDPDFTWEATDKAAQLSSDAGLREPVAAGVRK